MLPQLGGYVKDYENNVSFVTVHDSGHMVPQYKPLAAFHLFVRGLLNKPLAPPLNQTCLEGDGCSDDEFFGYNDTMGYLGNWVKKAQSPEYTASGEFLSRGKAENVVRSTREEGN